MSTVPLLREIGTNFWNLRGVFNAFGPFFNICTQMSFVKLSTGKFLVFSTVKLSPTAKIEIDRLTDNGKLIEAVIATHPFHTLAFTPFYEYYPNTKYYGCPRHLRVLKNIPWTGMLFINIESLFDYYCRRFKR